MSARSSTAVDWEAVWRSLDWGSDRQLQALQETLAQRAARYAQPLPEETTVEQGALVALAFYRGQERYAVPVVHAMQGLDAARITPLPCVPPFYRGVINVRGRILSVVDLARFWGVPAPDPPGVSKLLILGAAGFQIAVQVDDILGVIDIPLQDIVPPVVAGVALDHVQGVSSTGIVILDVEGLLRDRRLIVHEEL